LVAGPDGHSVKARDRWDLGAGARRHDEVAIADLPPTRDFSTSATEPPASATPPATHSPAEPAPKTTTSNLSVGQHHLQPRLSQQWEMISSNTPAQQKDDKHDDRDEHYRSDTDIHGLVPSFRRRMALADP
jgi:hypothetical protein